MLARWPVRVRVSVPRPGLMAAAVSDGPAPVRRRSCRWHECPPAGVADDDYGWLLEVLEHTAGYGWAVTRGFLLTVPELPLRPEEMRDHGAW